MRVKYSKDFEKSVRKLSGKTLASVKNTILEVKKAECLAQISDCKKLTGYNNVYRIRIGNLRAFFVLHIEIVGDCVFLNPLERLKEKMHRYFLKSLYICTPNQARVAEW